MPTSAYSATYQPAYSLEAKAVEHVGKVGLPLWVLCGIIYGGLLIPSIFHLPVLALFPGTALGLIFFYFLDRWLIRREIKRLQRDE